MAGEKSAALAPQPVTRNVAVSPTSNGAPETGSSASSQSAGTVALTAGAALVLGSAIDRTRKQDSNVTKSKALGLTAGLLGKSVGATEGTQRSLKDALVTGGKDKNANIALGLSGLDKLTGRNFKGLYGYVSGKDVFDLLDSKKEPKPIPPSLQQNSALARLRRRGDPLFSFDWEVILPNDLVDGFISSQTDGLRSNSNLSDYVEDVSIAPFSYATENVFRKGSLVYYPGFVDVGSFSVTFYEDNRMSAAKFVNYWMSLIRNNKDGYYYSPSNYKRDVVVLCKSATGFYVGGFVAKQCWPAERQSFNLQSATSDPVKYTLTFATDGVEVLTDPDNTNNVNLQQSPTGRAVAEQTGPFNLRSGNSKLNKMLQDSGINEKLNNAVNPLAGFLKK